MRAAVLNEAGDGKLEIRDDVRTVDVGPDEVRVRVVATGVCHSDLTAIEGGVPVMLPCVLGHEASGDVVEVGSQVTDIAVGDRVILCWLPACLSCRFCLAGQFNLCMMYVMKAFTEPKFVVGDTPGFGISGTGAFAEELVVPRPGVVKIDDDVPYDIAALIGCSVMTGVGSVLNKAKVQPGSSVLVIGCGGIGISVVQGARIAGAAQIVAVDPVEKKRAWVSDFGATHAVSPDELPQVLQDLTGGEGFDYTFEAVGRSQTIRSAYDATRRGGTAVVVGAGRVEDMVQFSAFELLFMERTIMSSVYGSADVRRDYPKLIALWRAGRLELERMITSRMPLENVNDAFAALRDGEVIRQLVELR